jgi:hypothetical protein
MRVLQTVPEDIHLIVDFRLVELMDLFLLLENCTFNYDSTNEAHMRAKEYLEVDLYPQLKLIIEETLKDGLGSKS